MGTARTRERRVSPVAWLLILPIRFYQRFITPYTPATCRYYPTCSAYAVSALRTHGAIKGVLLTAGRLLRCNPWSSGGVDYIPEHGRWRSTPPVYDDEADHTDARDQGRDPVIRDSVTPDDAIPEASAFSGTSAIDAALATTDPAAADVATASTTRSIAA